VDRAKVASLLALLAIVVFASALMVELYRLYYLPPGFDVGAWITYAKALIGESGSAWVTRYHPYLVHNSLLALFLRVFGDEILAAQAFAIFLFALRPLATYLLSLEVLGSRSKAVLVSFFVALHASFFEVWGWGGYPNLLGFALSPLALYFVVGAVEKRDMRSLLLALGFSLLTIPCHLLTALVLVATILVWLFTYGTVEVVLRRKPWRELSTFGVVSLPLMAALLGYAWLAVSMGWFEENPAALANRIGLGDFVYAFHGFRVYLSIVFVVVAFPCLFASFRRAVRSADDGMVLRYSLLLSCVLAPLALTQLWIFGVYLDFARFVFFLIQPLAIAVAGYVDVDFVSVPRRWLKNLGATSMLALLVSVSVLSVPASFEVVKWYHLNLPSGEDAGVLEAVEWVKANSQVGDVVVSSEYLGGWVSGLAEVNVLQTFPLRFAFSRGEVERSLDAETIISSNYTLSSPDFQILEQGEVQLLNPLIRVNRNGVYQDLAYLNDALTDLYVAGNGSPLTLQGFEPSISMTVNATQASTRTIYDLNLVSLVRIVEMDSKSPFIDLVISVDGGGVFLEGLTLQLPLASDREILSVIVDGTGVTLDTDLGRFRIDAYGAVEEVKTAHGNSTDSQTILFSFGSQGGSIDARLRFEDPDAGASAGPLVYRSSRQLVKAYGVKYVLTLWNEYEYNRNLEDSDLFRLVLRNDRVSIFEVGDLNFKG